MQIARRADRTGKPLSPILRDEIVGTQMPAPDPPKYDPTFDGWTLNEKIAFHEHGTVPERYRR